MKHKHVDLFIALAIVGILIAIHSAFRNLHECLIKPLISDKSEWAGSAHNYHRMIYHSAKVKQLRDLKAEIVAKYRTLP